MSVFENLDAKAHANFYWAELISKPTNHVPALFFAAKHWTTEQLMLTNNKLQHTAVIECHDTCQPNQNLTNAISYGAQSCSENLPFQHDFLASLSPLPSL